MTLVFADRNSPAIAAAWDGLSHILITECLGSGEDLAQLHEGEEWQYMGSELTQVGMLHCFRHREHPATKRREYRWVTTEPLETENPQ